MNAVRPLKFSETFGVTILATIGTPILLTIWTAILVRAPRVVFSPHARRGRTLGATLASPFVAFLAASFARPLVRSFGKPASRPAFLTAAAGLARWFAPAVSFAPPLCVFHAAFSANRAKVALS